MNLLGQIVIHIWEADQDPRAVAPDKIGSLPMAVRAGEFEARDVPSGPCPAPVPGGEKAATPDAAHNRLEREFAARLAPRRPRRMNPRWLSGRRTR